VVVVVVVVFFVVVLDAAKADVLRATATSTARVRNAIAVFSLSEVRKTARRALLLTYN
jgi:hypothetical protein